MSKRVRHNQGNFAEFDFNVQSPQTLSAAITPRLFSFLFFFLILTTGRAQSLNLTQNSFFPDSNIVHTGLQSRWVGVVNWQFNPGVNYSLTYTFGDGQGYSVSKVASSSNHGSDTFCAKHAYAASGFYTAKVVLKNASGTPIDSLIRPFSVGSGFVVAGKVYYDCIKNCSRDSGELGMGTRMVGIRIKQQDRLFLTDSEGNYNVAVATGDTLFGLGSIPYHINTTIGTMCAPPPITSNNRSANLAVRLIDGAYMGNLRLNTHACQNGPFEVDLDLYDLGWGTPSVRVFYGDGWVTGYLSTFGGTNIHHFYGYQTPGIYNLYVELYDAYSAGPYMRFNRTIHVDSCRTIVLKPYQDANKNCLSDSGELQPSIGSLSVQSKKMSYINGAYFNNGRLEYKHFPGDTALVDSVLLVSGTLFGDTVHLRKNCPGLFITDSTPDSLDLPYGTHVRGKYLTQPFGILCYADTLTFQSYWNLVGYPAGMGFKFISDFGDGHIDTLSFKASTDTVYLNSNHRYDTGGLWNYKFILLSDFGDADTLRGQLTVNNCFPVYVRAFYDRNKNCVQDIGEAFAKEFKINTHSGQYFSDPASGVVKARQYIPLDSVALLMDYKGSFHQGRYTVERTATAGCYWPPISIPGAQVLLPLVDFPTFHVRHSPDMYPPCDLKCGGSVDVSVFENFGHPYTLLYYPGDGLTVDTLHLRQQGHLYSVRNFVPGLYQPAYRIYDDSTGELLAKGNLWSFLIQDTCGGSGQLFADNDADCAFGANDLPIVGLPVQFISGTDTSFALTDTGGHFWAPILSASDSVIVVDTFAGFYLSCGISRSTAMQAGAPLSFPYACAMGDDLSLLAAHHYFRDKSVDTLILYPSGFACNDGPGTLSVTLPAGLSYTGADISGGVVVGSTISWSIDTLRKLPPVIRIGLNCATAPGTAVLCLSASLNGTTPDPVPANNDFYLCDSIRSNIPEFYKSLSSDSMYANGALLDGKEIIYSLRIRNSSPADTIHSVILFDSLDARLDLSTLHIMDASFPNSAQLLTGRVLRIMSHGDVQLPPGAEAAIRFGIMPQSGLASGTIIPNRFTAVLDGVPQDSSNAVTASAARQPTKVRSARVKDLDVSVYPVPAFANASIYIQLPEQYSAKGRYELLDVRGTTCLTGTLAGPRTRVDLPDLAPGVYLLRVVNGGGIGLKKLVVMGAGE